MRRIFNRVSVLVATVALCLGPISNAAGTKHADSESRDVPHAIAKKISVPGVGNLGEVTPTLFRGAQPSERGFESLAKMGIAIVVDLREGGQVQREQEEVTALGMKFVAISWNCTEPKDEYFSKFLTLLRDNPGKKVFVHCHAGVDRTGMMIASYRMAEQGWTSDESMREMKTFGYSMFHQMMCHALEGYEDKFPTVVSNNPVFQTTQVAQKANTSTPVSATLATITPKQ
ncbi:MAG: fused DSP-PTPase phosphatase/NAD kinase-like protein [Candidatus Acidiferrales bacterium]